MDGEKKSRESMLSAWIDDYDDDDDGANMCFSNLSYFL